jgi:hypothetical protein
LSYAEKDFKFPYDIYVSNESNIFRLVKKTRKTDLQQSENIGLIENGPYFMKMLDRLSLENCYQKS